MTHKDLSLDDAVDRLDSRRPLTYRELRSITGDLYDAALEEGKNQSIKAVQDRLLGISLRCDDTGFGPELRRFLTELTATLDHKETTEDLALAEYRDPTEVIREKLANRQRNA